MVPQHKYTAILLAALVLLVSGGMAPAYADSCCSGGTMMKNCPMQMVDASSDAVAKEDPGKKAPQVQAVTVTGTNFCTFCQVTNKESAMAECARNGHKMAVKVKEAKDADGKALPGLKGQALNYTQNDNAKTLADKEHFNQTVTMTGTLTGKRNFEVTKISGVGEEKAKPTDAASAPAKEQSANAPKQSEGSPAKADEHAAHQHHH